MHELSIVQSVLNMAEAELAKHELSRLTSVTVRYGALANVVPEAMTMAWECLTQDTPHQGSPLVLEEVPVVLRCHKCKTEFTPQDGSILLAACPACGEDFGHQVVSGKELFLQSLEAE